MPGTEQCRESFHMAPPLDVCSELKGLVEQRSATIAGQGQALITAGNEMASLQVEIERMIDEQEASEKKAGAAVVTGVMTPLEGKTCGQGGTKRSLEERAGAVSSTQLGLLVHLGASVHLSLNPNARSGPYFKQFVVLCCTRLL